MLEYLYGLLTGIFVGAAGKYVADKYTDQRKAQEQRKAKRAVFLECENHMPALFAEMRRDLKEHPICREFILMNQVKGTVNPSNPLFTYLRLEQPGLRAKLVILENNGFVENVTNIDRYRMSEEFVKLLMKGD